MPINRAEQSLEDRLVNEVAELRRSFLELKKTVQPVGADAILLERIPAVGTANASFSIPAGNITNVEVESEPANETLTLWNFLYSVYIDTDSPTYEWPTGSSLTSGLVGKFDVYSNLSWASSSDVTNTRVLIVSVTNRDTVAHDIYFKFRAYLPKLTGSSVS